MEVLYINSCDIIEREKVSYFMRFDEYIIVRSFVREIEFGFD